MTAKTRETQVSTRKSRDIPGPVLGAQSSMLLHEHRSKHYPKGQGQAKVSPQSCIGSAKVCRRGTAVLEELWYADDGFWLTRP